MKTLRTPNERFENLPDFPYEPHYCEIDTGYNDIRLRIHYLDEGAHEAPLALLLHGEPTWSFLWRKMIPPLTEAGYRVVAVDLPGFGRSDKPADSGYFSFDEITHWVRMALFLQIGGMGDREVAVIGQGLGALIGLSLASAHWRSLNRIVVTGPIADLRPAPNGAEASLTHLEYAPRLQRQSAGEFVQAHTLRQLEPEVLRAYDAPFLDAGHRVGVGASLARESLTEGSLGRLWQELGEKRIETLFISGEEDDFGVRHRERSDLPVRQATIAEAGHFLPEDQPVELASICVDFLQSAG